MNRLSSQGWTASDQLPSSLSKSLAPSRPSLQFTQTMRGYLSTKVTDDYHHAAEQGRLDRSRFEFTLTISTDDLQEALAGPGHRFRIVGTVRANSLSARPLTVTAG